jgi:hypothetical protein
MQMSQCPASGDLQLVCREHHSLEDNSLQFSPKAADAQGAAVFHGGSLTTRPFHASYASTAGKLADSLVEDILHL